MKTFTLYLMQAWIYTQKNSRSQYSNLLPKVIKPIKENSDGLYLSLESLILEKTFVQFNSDSNTPDIFWYDPLNSHSREFFLSNSTFDSAKSLLIVLRNEIRSTSQYFESIDTVNLQKYQLLKIDFKSGFFQLKAGNYLNVYFSKRFLTFLGFVLIKKAVFLNL